MKAHGTDECIEYYQPQFNMNMKKNLLWMFAAIFFCGLTVTLLTACSDDADNTGTPPIDKLSEKIRGKWMMAEVNGQPVPTNSKQVLTYESDTKFSYSLSISAISDLNVWVNHCEGRVNINGNLLEQTVELPDANISFSHKLNISSITDNEMVLVTNNETFVDGKSYRITKDLKERKVRVTKDYSDDIIGIWEGRLTSDQDAYSDTQMHRWEYKDDGTFVYYRQDENGEWVADVNTMAEYFVDGTLMCSRWKNVGDPTEKRESWEIASIENGKMEWTALRQNEDGSTYTANFSMTRVNSTAKTLMGEWLAVVNRSDIDEDEDETAVEYVLLTFGDNGVLNQDVYIGDTKEPITHWERMCRHGIYTLDETVQTFTFEIGSQDITTVPYSMDNDQLHLTYIVEMEEPYEMTLTFHRPSKAEKDLINMYNVSLLCDDYVGKWFSVQEEDGKQIYHVLEFTDNSTLNTVVYTVENGKVTRTTDTQYVSDVDDAEDDEPMFEIHSSSDYNQKGVYYWDVTSNILTLELMDEEAEEGDEVFYLYHALTKADIAKIAELDKKMTEK